MTPKRARRIPNLNAAREECDSRGVKYYFEFTANTHIKFYINGYPNMIMLSANNDIHEKVRRKVKKAIDSIKASV